METRLDPVQFIKDNVLRTSITLPGLLFPGSTAPECGLVKVDGRDAVLRMELPEPAMRRGRLIMLHMELPEPAMRRGRLIMLRMMTDELSTPIPSAACDGGLLQQLENRGAHSGCATLALGAIVSGTRGLRVGAQTVWKPPEMRVLLRGLRARAPPERDTLSGFVARFEDVPAALLAERFGMAIVEYHLGGTPRQALFSEPHEREMRRCGLQLGSAPAFAVDQVAGLWSTATLLLLGGHDALEVAAWVHNTFVAVHPLEDGNGRAARALANWVLLMHRKQPLRMFEEAFRNVYDGAVRADLASKIAYRDPEFPVVQYHNLLTVLHHLHRAFGNSVAA